MSVQFLQLIFLWTDCICVAWLVVEFCIKCLLGIFFELDAKVCWSVAYSCACREGLAPVHIPSVFLTQEMCWIVIRWRGSKLFFCSRIKEFGCKQGLISCYRSCLQLLSLFSVILPIFLFSTFSAMSLASKVSNMCGGSHQKRPRSSGSYSFNHELTKSRRRNGMDRVRARPNLTSSDMAGTRIRFWDVTRSDVHDGVDVETIRQYDWVANRNSAVVVLVRPARDAALERTRWTGGWDWDNLSVLDNLVQSKYLHSRRLGTFAVGREGKLVVVNG